MKKGWYGVETMISKKSIFDARMTISCTFCTKFL